MAAWGRKGAGDDLFSAQEVSSYADGQTLEQDQAVQAQNRQQARAKAEQGQAIKRARAEELLKVDSADPVSSGRGGRKRARQTMVDDSALKAAVASADGSAERFAMDKRLRSIALLAVALLVVYACAVLFPQNLVTVLFSGDAAAARFSELMQANIGQLGLVLSGKAANGLSHSSLLVFALVGIAGAGLGAVGAAYQGSFNNALASPSTLGVMSGASCGMVLYMIVGAGGAIEATRLVVTTKEQAAAFEGGAVSPLGVYLGQVEGVLWSFVGALVVVFLTVLIAKLAGKGKLGNATIVIAGQVFGAIASAIVVLFRLFLQTTAGQDGVNALASLQTGDFTRIGYIYDLFFMGIPVLVCIGVLIFFSGKLNLLAFGDEQARMMGPRPSVLRGIVIGVSTLATAVIVSFVGAVGFVGFMIPHLVRRVVGPDFRYLLPASALAGAAFTIAVQYAYSCIPGADGGVGLVTTCLGAVVFLFAIVNERRVPHEGSRQEF
ncbi:MAG: iron ABC transporter permease [Coriobacteriia bacterium]|nr:iron ABC transporter permease [Coriobacteriia bacterium]